MTSSTPTSATTTASEFAWMPTEAYLKDNRLLRLIERTGSDDYPGLLAKAAEDPTWYWEQALADLDLVWQKPWSQIMDLSRGKAWPTWFPDAEFNYVVSALDRHVDGPDADQAAVIWEGDDESTRTLTFQELGAMTDQFAHVLQDLGVGHGDKVGIFLPMIPEVVAATLACGKLGAIYVPLFSGYGEESIVSRLGDCDTRVLITADGFYRRGKLVPMKTTADKALERLPSIEHCIVVQRTGEPVDWNPDRDIWWHDAMAGASAERLTVPTAADDPYMILYTSGTTGRPKG
ncbi:MAG: AMP-binding protein, partial [Thermomicrobiales bacterium]